jgi:hypothetical protein
MPGIRPIDDHRSKARHRSPSGDANVKHGERQDEERDRESADRPEGLP